jgi:hypothetical protein
MSMIGCFYALEDQDMQAIIEKPKRIAALWQADLPSVPVPHPNLLCSEDLFSAKRAWFPRPLFALGSLAYLRVKNPT